MMKNKSKIYLRYLSKPWKISKLHTLIFVHWEIKSNVEELIKMSAETSFFVDHNVPLIIEFHLYLYYNTF